MDEQHKAFATTLLRDGATVRQVRHELRKVFALQVPEQDVLRLYNDVVASQQKVFQPLGFACQTDPNSRL